MVALSLVPILLYLYKVGGEEGLVVQAALSGTFLGLWAWVKTAKRHSLESECEQ